MSSVVDVIDNTAEALREIERAKARGLEKCGLVAERYAKKNIKANKSIVTSNLINSITHKRVGDEEYVGTNVEYAPYVELGTGIYATGGSGAKKIPWVYQDSKGKWHRTSGQQPKPYLKPAARDHTDEYKQIMKEALEGK